MWVFEDRRDGTEVRSNLGLSWEVDLSAYSDDFDPAEIDAVELWSEWRRIYRDYAHPVLGEGWFSILWSVEDGESHWSEFAPFANHDLMTEGIGFFDRFTWPRDADTDEPLRWTELPVFDRRWSPGHADRGGFVQEATGWKPGLLQPYVHIPSLAKAAGLA